MLLGRAMLLCFSSKQLKHFSIPYQSCDARGYLSKTICFSMLCRDQSFLYLRVARELFPANLIFILAC